LCNSNSIINKQEEEEEVIARWEDNKHKVVHALLLPLDDDDPKRHAIWTNWELYHRLIYELRDKNTKIFGTARHLVRSLSLSCLVLPVPLPFPVRMKFNCFCHLCDDVTQHDILIKLLIAFRESDELPLGKQRLLASSNFHEKIFPISIINSAVFWFH